MTRALLLFFLAGCSIEPIVMSGLACEEDLSCLEGYTCDAEVGVCIATGDGCAGEGRRIPCTPGATDCTDGCRTCVGAVWSDCGIPTAECQPNAVACDSVGNLVTCDAEGNVDSSSPCPNGCNDAFEPPRCNACEPSTTVCDGGDLIVCNTDGEIDTSTSCPFGCNDSLAPLRCNECTPSSTRCDVLTWIECDSAGLVSNQTDCRTSNACVGAGTCDDTTGCGVTSTAEDGTPCDQDAGADGDWCNSSCQSGVCMDGVAPDCADGLACTSTGCDDASGCTLDFEPVTTECNPSTGPCDDAEYCTGSSGGCPVDQLAAPGTVCRPSTDDCDAAELCSGTAATCPTDELEPSDVECRASAGPCDLAETCTGSDVACPPDAFEPSSTSCRPSSGGLCDLEDFCPGDAADCPDAVASSGTTCRPAADECDFEEVCDGNNATCPTDQGKTDGTPCDTGRCAGSRLTTTVCDGFRCSNTNTINCNDAQACNGVESCDPAGCVPGSGGSCDDGCACSFETCTDPATCVSSDYSPCTTASLTGSNGTAGVPMALTLDLNCAGAAANITCTAESARHCLAVQTFEANNGGYVLVSTDGIADNAECDADGEINSSGCTDSDNDALGPGDVLRLLPTWDDAITRSVSAELSSALDLSGFTDLRVGFDAAFSNESGELGQDEDISARACCDAGPGCASDITNELGVARNADGQPWAPRGSFDLPPATFDDCGALWLGFHYQCNYANEMVHIDNVVLSGIGSPTLRVNDRGDGTYAVVVAACEATTIDVTCTWDNPVGGNPSATTSVTFN